MPYYVPMDEKKSGDGGLKPGTYLAYVVQATERESQAGNPYINLMLADTNTDSILCFDVVMLGARTPGEEAPPGAWIGGIKASTFGLGQSVDKDGGGSEYEIPDPPDWIDARVVVRVVEEEWNGKIRLAPDKDFGRFGYAPASEWESLKEPAFGGDDEPLDPDLPF